MSKIIVEMEMPKHMCGDCEISINGFACKKSRTNGGKCPIVGVLPDEHGDLIDRDEVKQKMIHYGFHAIDMTATEFCEDELHAVIAAERKDDGTTAD